MEILSTLIMRIAPNVSGETRPHTKKGRAENKPYHRKTPAHKVLFCLSSVHESESLRCSNPPGKTSVERVKKLLQPQLRLRRKG